MKASGGDVENSNVRVCVAIKGEHCYHLAVYGFKMALNSPLKSMKRENERMS